MVDIPHVLPTTYIQQEEVKFKAAVSENTMNRVGAAINALIDQTLKRVVFTVPGATTWTCPLGVNVIIIEACGGGGGGSIDGYNGGDGGHTLFNSIIIGPGAEGSRSGSGGNGNTLTGYGGYPGGSASSGPTGGTSSYFYSGGGPGDTAGGNHGSGGGASDYGPGAQGAHGGPLKGDSALPTSYGAGGGGGYFAGGGGGGSQKFYSIQPTIPGTVYPITIGSAGIGTAEGGNGAGGYMAIIYVGT